MKLQATRPDAPAQPFGVVQPCNVIAVDDALLRMSTVNAITGLSPATIYRFVKAGTFPTPIKFGSRCVRWRSALVREWLKAQGEEVVA